MSISLENNILTIKGEDVDLFKAIALKKILEDLLAEGCRNVEVSFIGVKRISATAFQVLSTIGKRFDEFKIISAETTIKEKFKETIYMNNC